MKNPDISDQLRTIRRLLVDYSSNDEIKLQYMDPPSHKFRKGNNSNSKSKRRNKVKRQHKH
jgi:hypothetical protein